MENGIYVVKLDLHDDEYEIAELFNGKWFPFRSLSTKFSEKDVVFCKISFDDPINKPQFSVTFPDEFESPHNYDEAAT